MDLPRRFPSLRRLAAGGLLLALLAGPAAALADVRDEILSQTATLRGLAPKAAVPFAFVDPAQLRTDLLSSYEDPEAIREIEISRKLLVMLGLFSPDADLQSILTDLFAENIQGYYNRVDKKMYVVAGQPNFGPSEKVTLAHEFTHALQDQYFDLERVRLGTEDNGDHAQAVTALIEGDATLTMVLYARTYLTPDELFELQTAGAASTLDRAPAIVRDEVTFPYNEGALFVLRLWQNGGYQRVNEAFADPPRSTEQVMHPEKYLAHELPIDVTLPDLAAALGPGWAELRRDVLGELDVRIILDQFLDPIAAAGGATGWGGDQYAILENTAGDNALVIGTAWDSEADAAEFFADYVSLVGRRYGGRAARIADEPARLAWTTPNGVLSLQRWGPRVAIVMAPNERAMQTLAGAVAPGGVAPAPPPGPSRAPAQVPGRS